MKILVSGSRGLVGAALLQHLDEAGHSTVPLLRERPADGQVGVHWDPIANFVDTDAMEGAEAVVHLAGENIAQGRWNNAKKQRIRDSRVDGTRLLSAALSGLQNKPRVLVCASAIGYYGDRNDEVLTELSARGSGYLPEVCRDWEAASGVAENCGIRVVLLRYGVILSASGGALAKMLKPFKMGVGGKIGGGQQYMSWITLDDAVGVIMHAIQNDMLSGPVNAVSPNPVTNLEYTKTLGRVIGRPTLFPMPALAARAAFGEMANDLLLASARVEPAKLRKSGYTFRHPELEGALKHLLE